MTPVVLTGFATIAGLLAGPLTARMLRPPAIRMLLGIIARASASRGHAE